MEVSLLTGGTERTLETVKVLHETILALRTALEGSRKELLQLKGQTRYSRISNGSIVKKNTAEYDVPRRYYFVKSMEKEKEEKKIESKFIESAQDEGKPDSGTESDDIDDIELVFTTGETDPSSIQEDLVPIIEENERKYLTNSVVVETDISKCGVIDESEINLSGRRNTLPDPLPYQPIIHREILAASRMAPARSPCKALQPGTQEMSAQTDITAVPTHWKSETYLAQKLSNNLTTLPSKFTLPVPQPKRLPLSDKTREARRVLLSDINFTSMVPELSRSADHLHDEKTATKNQTSAFDYIKSPRTENCCYSRQESRSSCGSYYGSRYYTSSTSIPPFVCEESRRRHSWRPPHMVCSRSTQFWSSVPSSPIKCHHESSREGFCHLHMRKRKPRVHFHHCDPCGQSMPNLRLDVDSGESTDSLVEEAEEFLRRSIDSMIITKSFSKRRERSCSDTEYISSFEPPMASQPFLPKSSKDLRRDCFVKVITPEGRIVVGKVRYSGHVPGRSEPYVGVELANNSGFSDGTFMGQHFFDCDIDHAVFVPFKKVVLAWSN